MISKSIRKHINIRTIFTGLIVLAFFTAPVFPATQGQDISKGIFMDALNSEAVPFLNTTSGSDNGKVVRSRFVKVDFNQISRDSNLSGTHSASLDKLLQLNLFDDVFVIARWDKEVNNRSGSTTLIGKSLAEGHSSVILTLKDNIMVGSVALGNDNYVIRYIGGDIHEIRQMDHSKYAECKDALSSNPMPLTKGGGIDLSGVKADDGSVIDVLVVYTFAARNAAGGTTAMQNLIDQGVSETNTGYNNSFVNPDVNLVHTAELEYSENSFSWGQTLNRLVGTSEGYMDGVHALRDTYKADVVVMIVNNGGYCGLANMIMANAAGAFCLVSRTCVTGYYSFAHEIGHLQGARHDRYVDPTENSPYTYNHGYTYPAANWRTIMAYNNACTAVGKNCTRLNYWSNPNVFYGGVRMGNAGGIGEGADNHRCLNNTAYTVANFRVSGGATTYCASTSTNINFAYISAVEFGDFYNTSGASGYSNFTSLSRNMTRGGNVNLALTGSHTGDAYHGYWRIWIDYNQDGDFSDAGEQVFSGHSNGNVLGSFTVSSGATTGSTRMRIVMQHGNYRSSACGTFTLGEVEDYTVNIL
ncbi:MAG: hypothetical protein GY940_34450 [bacterium]|nr:hypothetical protein [bacterium]